MEGLGKKFKDARIARNLTLEEAARMTKIRPGRLGEIENEDFSHFPSLAYAKGFLLIYGKFLDVDVSPYLEAFETSEHMTVDGYSYLQENPAPAPRRPAVVRRSRPSSGPGKPSLMPMVLTVLAIVLGFFFLKLMLDIQRIKPRTGPQVETMPAPAAEAKENIIAPRALPADGGTPPSVAAATPVPVATTPPPAVTSSTSGPTQAPPAAQPEVRRAEPVRPEDLAKAPDAAGLPSPAEPGVNRVQIRPLKRTYVKVVVNNDDQNPVFERWISTADGVVQFTGERVAVKILDRDAVEIRKNGKAISRSDNEVTIE